MQRVDRQHRNRSRIILATVLTVLLLPLSGSGLAATDPPTPSPPSPPSPPSLILLTLDTTRADHLGAYGDAAARTPHLDALARRGTRYARALTASPLTLPAHASLLTGLDPLAHGVQDNGTMGLDGAVPTLATVLAGMGYTTGAFIASRVLDRRFGLARGFDVYDDRMTAEIVGEYGYPERDAAAVSDAALAWLSGLPPESSYFLWAHYYDPHAPYEPDYRGEIAFMDSQIGRLLVAAGERPGPLLVAAVGDHGEALGEHGERSHGIFLYRASLEVPMILAGPGVPEGQVVAETVASRRLAASLLHLLRLAASPATASLATDLPGTPLPGTPLPGLGVEVAPEGVYSSTWMPASAYGWAPLEAWSEGRWRLIKAPRPELYDFVDDPDEVRNRLDDARAEARRLRLAFERHRAAMEQNAAPPVEVDAELAAQLRSLGYLSGSSPSAGQSTIDPKDGILLLEELHRAKLLLGDGRNTEALAVLEGLVRQNPGNVPFLTNLASAQLAAGQATAAIATYRRAISLNPRLDFLHLHLAETYHRLDRLDEAKEAYEIVLELNPRAASAWLGLAEFAARRGDGDEERRLLEAAVEAGTASAGIHMRLAQIAVDAGALRLASEHLEEATQLAPRWPAAALFQGRVLLRLGETSSARRILERLAAQAPSTPEGREARRLLSGL